MWFLAYRRHLTIVLSDFRCPMSSSHIRRYLRDRWDSGIPKKSVPMLCCYAFCMTNDQLPLPILGRLLAARQLVRSMMCKFNRNCIQGHGFVMKSATAASHLNGAVLHRTTLQLCGTVYQLRYPVLNIELMNLTQLCRITRFQAQNSNSSGDILVSYRSSLILMGFRVIQC